MTDLNITLLGNTPQDIVLSGSGMTVQNKSETETLIVKLQGSSAIGGFIYPKSSANFGSSITIWNPTANAPQKVDLYVVKN